MDFTEIVKDAFDIAFLKESVMKKVAGDKNALRSALLIVVLASIVSAFAYYVFPTTYGAYISYRPDLVWLIRKAVWIFALNMMSLYLMAYLSVTLFKSKLNMQSFVQVMGYGMIVGLIAIIPTFTIVVGVWELLIMWHVLTKLGKLEAAEIIVLFVISIVAFTLVGMSSLAFLF